MPNILYLPTIILKPVNFFLRFYVGFFSGNNSIPPAAIDRPREVPVDVKLHIIETARKWPLYFSRFYGVIEERDHENVYRIMGISESGIRLVSQNFEDRYEPFCITDHFELEFPSVQFFQYFSIKILKEWCLVFIVAV